MQRIFQTTNRKLFGIRNSIEDARSISPLKQHRFDVDNDKEVEVGALDKENMNYRESFMDIMNKSHMVEADQPI